MNIQKTTVNYVDGRLRITTTGVPTFSLQMNESDAKFITSAFRLVFLEGKQEGSNEAFESAKKAFRGLK